MARRGDERTSRVGRVAGRASRAGRTSPASAADASPEATLAGTPAYAVSARDASAIMRSPAAPPPLDDDGSDMPRVWARRRAKRGRARRDLAGGHLRATMTRVLMMRVMRRVCVM